MTDEIKQSFKAVAVPGVPMLVYAIGTYTVCALHPTIPINTQLALFAPIMVLMGWCWDVLIRLSEATARGRGEPEVPYRVIRGGFWLECGSIAITLLAIGSGVHSASLFLGVGIAIVGACAVIAGAVWAAPAEISIWRAGRQAKRGI